MSWPMIMTSRESAGIPSPPPQTKLNSVPLYANQVIGGMLTAIYSKLWGWRGLCAKFQDDCDVWEKDTWEQTYVGFYLPHGKTVFPVLCVHRFLHTESHTFGVTLILYPLMICYNRSWGERQSYKHLWTTDFLGLCSHHPGLTFISTLEAFNCVLNIKQPQVTFSFWHLSTTSCHEDLYLFVAMCD